MRHGSGRSPAAMSLSWQAPNVSFVLFVAAALSQRTGLFLVQAAVDIVLYEEESPAVHLFH